VLFFFPAGDILCSLQAVSGIFMAFTYDSGVKVTRYFGSQSDTWPVEQRVNLGVGKPPKGPPRQFCDTLRS